MKRILKLLAAGVVCVLLLATGFFYWTAIRPLAVTSGTVTGSGFPHASASRDRLGIPHIEAQSVGDALWVQGYVTAQDRLWQMDTSRRLAAGELAEVLGPSMLAVDRDSRTLGMRRAAAAALSAFSPAERAEIEAYRRGVNAFINSHRSNLPLEFQWLHYQPRPWEPIDSALVGMNMFRSLTTSWKDELMKRALLERATPAQVAAMLPVWTGREAAPGSNAWAVSGKHTATGKPLFANDPHLSYSIPCIWYTIHLKAPGLDVIGVSVPGLPGVIIGHNERIAWGATNLQFDVQDLYLAPKPERTEREVIHVRGRPDETVDVGYTRYGPVVAQVGGEAAALRWTAADPAAWSFPFLDMDRARDWESFRAALARYGGPAQNWIYTDVDGNIGYQAAGKLPIRRGYDGSLPVAGDGRFEWQGYIPFDQLPRAYNPAAGILVTANQNPFPRDYPFPVNGNFAAPYRSNRIRKLLEQGSRFQAPDFLQIETDVYSPFAHFFAQQLLEAVGRRKPPGAGMAGAGMANAAAEIQAWDGQFRAEESAPVLVAIAYNDFLRHLVENMAGDRASVYTSHMGTAFTQEVLEARPVGWAKDYDELLRNALAEAIREHQARPAATATWGRYMETTIAHPLGHHIPVLRRWFDIGPFEPSGTTTTIKQTTTRLAPSMRLVVDLADLDHSLHNLTTGESGQPFSTHYKDQWQAYYQGRSFPLQFAKPEIVERLEFQPTR